MGGEVTPYGGGGKLERGPDGWWGTYSANPSTYIRNPQAQTGELGTRYSSLTCMLAPGTAHPPNGVGC